MTKERKNSQKIASAESSLAANLSMRRSQVVLDTPDTRDRLRPSEAITAELSEEEEENIVESIVPIEGEIVPDEIDSNDLDSAFAGSLETSLEDDFQMERPDVVEISPAADYFPQQPHQAKGVSSRASSKDIVQYDPLRSYLNEIRNLPTLSREEEHELAVQFKSGDRNAGYRLVMANLRLVVIIAREYQRNVQNILDLVQEGNIGLLEAVKKFDPFRGIRFPSYAVYWIRAYMLRYLINNVRLVKIGTTQAQRKLFFNLMKEKDRLEKEGFVPEAKLLADRLSVKESEVLEMEQRLALPEVSVDQPVSRGSEDSLDLHGILADDRESSEEVVVRDQLNETVRKAIQEFKTTADAKEQAIIDRRLFTEDPVTLQEIADQFGVSRERIRQIEERLKRKLKNFLSEQLQMDTSE